MVTWKEAQARKLASMTDAERAEYDALGPQVEAEIAAAELLYQQGQRSSSWRVNRECSLSFVRRAGHASQGSRWGQGR